MSNPTDPGEDLTPTEASLGKALALIHRALSRLDDPTRRTDVQRALGAAASLIESARVAHLGSAASPTPLGVSNVSTNVDPRIAAVIAAAVSVVIDQPHRLVSVQQTTAPLVPHLNVWAVEGRTQIFMSHRVR